MGRLWTLKKKNHYSPCQQKEKGAHRSQSNLGGSLPVAKVLVVFGVRSRSHGLAGHPSGAQAVYAQGPWDMPPVCAASTAGSGLRGRRSRETATCLGPPWLRSDAEAKAQRSPAPSAVSAGVRPLKSAAGHPRPPRASLW